MTGEVESFLHRLPMQFLGTGADVFGNEEEKQGLQVEGLVAEVELTFPSLKPTLEPVFEDARPPLPVFFIHAFW